MFTRAAKEIGRVALWVGAFMVGANLHGCTRSDTIPGAQGPVLSVMASPTAPKYVTAGAVFGVTATATADGKPIVGLAVTFAGAPSTVTLTPSTGITNADGNATSYAFVPYGSEGTVVASGGGVASDPTNVSLLNRPIRLTAPSLCTVGGSFKVSSDGGAGPPGTVYDVCVTALVGSADGSTDAGIETVPGVPVTFSVLFPAGSAAPSIAPVSTATSSSGVAMTAIAVPPGVPNIVVAATTGTSTVENTFP
jgi:hypothetical protein